MAGEPSFDRKRAIRSPPPPPPNASADGAPADAWNPEQYERFKAERSQPFYDLAALVHPVDGPRVVDLGCGTGELTRALHERLGARQTIGVDNSRAMLARAANFAGDGLEFVERDIASYEPDGTVDVVLSNAALHWLDDHARLFARISGWLAPRGQLAVQMPANHDHPSHVVAHEIARSEPFRSQLQDAPRPRRLLEPEEYATLLARLGFRQQHVRLQVYGHWLQARDDVVEWVRGTLLTDYEKRLNPALFGEFLARYRAELLPRLDAARPFFYPFKRVLIWARR